MLTGFFPSGFVRQSFDIVARWTDKFVKKSYSRKKFQFVSYKKAFLSHTHICTNNYSHMTFTFCHHACTNSGNSTATWDTLINLFFSALFKRYITVQLRTPQLMIPSTFTTSLHAIDISHHNSGDYVSLSRARAYVSINYCWFLLRNFLLCRSVLLFLFVCAAP